MAFAIAVGNVLGSSMPYGVLRLLIRTTLHSDQSRPLVLSGYLSGRNFSIWRNCILKIQNQRICCQCLGFLQGACIGARHIKNRAAGSTNIDHDDDKKLCNWVDQNITSEIILPFIGAQENEMLVCGMALGHADQSDIVNTFRTPRVGAEEFTTWIE